MIVSTQAKKTGIKACMLLPVFLLFGLNDTFAKKPPGTRLPAQMIPRGIASDTESIVALTDCGV